MPKLTRDNFSIAEMTECSLAERLGIDNTPDFRTLENLGSTVTRLEEVRALLGFPVHVNSGYRSEKLEKMLSQADYVEWCNRNGQAVNDASWRTYFTDKPHSQGLAADFTCAQFGSPMEVVQAIQASSVKFDQCILEGSWVHISFAPRMRREVFVKKFDAMGISNSLPFPRPLLPTPSGKPS